MHVHIARIAQVNYNRIGFNCICTIYISNTILHKCFWRGGSNINRNIIMAASHKITFIKVCYLECAVIYHRCNARHEVSSGNNFYGADSACGILGIVNINLIKYLECCKIAYNTVFYHVFSAWLKAIAHVLFAA